MKIRRIALQILTIYSLLYSTSVSAATEAIRPEGRFVLLGDYRLYFHCLGKGNQTVLIDTGIGDSSANWLGIARSLSGDVRVCLFDRAGYGMSDPGPLPRSTSRIVAELYTILQKANIPGPYILVGHSFGGFTAQYFARVLPEQTAAVVLVESSHPEQVERLKELDTMPGSKPKKLIAKVEDSQEKISTEQAYWEMLNYQRKAIYAQMEELRAFEQSAKEVQALQPFPDIPLVVLSRGRSQLPSINGKYSLELVWQQMQSELAELSSQSHHVIVEDSGHSIHLETPEIVINTIRRMLNLNSRAG